ncbi:hypothetical protein QWI29_22295 [Mycolicibacterium neoaurum]|uniref:hypothetical protein n=1 Tax=Mycolicibacterium neoaurum TaxID=1795 RepID=UPI002673675F|nr:hypothetical protein [Mycolicibacterium neoaurum]MDO3402781.1 hypothetical protein [Mycolicibacterium neoaurum]
MSDLAGCQRNLDLYAAACYWKSAEDANKEATDMVAQLRARAVSAGASQDQLVDAEQYASNCFMDGRKPLAAGHSFSDFRERAAG